MMIRDWDEFIQKVAECIKTYLPEDFEAGTVAVEEIRKANGVCYHGLVVRRSGESVTPVVPLEPLWEQVQNGMGIDEAMEQITEVISANALRAEDVPDMVRLGDARQKICCTLINRDQNVEYLAGKPYRLIADLALIYHIRIQLSDGLTGRIIVTDELAGRINMNEEALFAAAMENIEEEQTCIESIRSMLDGLLEQMDTEDAMESEKTQMLVVTNRQKYHGASVILRPGVQNSLWKKMRGDYYLLPSSVHELIAVPKKGMEVGKLRDMVREVNRGVLSPEEFLSDEVYVLDNGELKVA